MTLTLLLVCGYFAVLVLVLALLTAAKRGDEAMADAVPEIRILPGGSHPGRGPVRWSQTVDVLPGHEELGDLADRIRHMLGVEQICVVVGDEHASGLVAACIDAPGRLGARTPVGRRAVTGLLDRDEAAAYGLHGETPGGASWSYAHVPLHGPDGLTGAIDVAARRVLPFSSGELRLIERLARRGTPRFERRRQVRAAA